jgi:hypothetical protein
MTVTCWNCPESYQLTLNGEAFELLPNRFEFDCPHEECGKANSIWQKDMVDGHKADCVHCDGQVLMSAALRPVVA